MEQKINTQAIELVVKLVAKTGLYFSCVDGEYADSERQFIEKRHASNITSTKNRRNEPMVFIEKPFRSNRLMNGREMGKADAS